MVADLGGRRGEDAFDLGPLLFGDDAQVTYGDVVALHTSHPDVDDQAVQATPYSYAAKLVRVTDGDTVVLDVDLGFRLRATMPFRLLGIDTPEMNTVEGRDARQWVLKWFEQHPDFTVASAKDPEKYGRWLAVIRPSSGASLNEALVAGGLARPYMT